MTRPPVFRPASTSNRVCVLAGGGRAPQVWPAGRPPAASASLPTAGRATGRDAGTTTDSRPLRPRKPPSPLPASCCPSPRARAPLTPTVLPAPLAPISAVSTPGRNALLTPRSSCRRPLWGPSSLRASQPCTQGGRGEWEDAAGWLLKRGGAGAGPVARLAAARARAASSKEGGARSRQGQVARTRPRGTEYPTPRKASVMGTKGSAAAAVPSGSSSAVPPRSSSSAAATSEPAVLPLFIARLSAPLPTVAELSEPRLHLSRDGSEAGGAPAPAPAWPPPLITRRRCSAASEVNTASRSAARGGRRARRGESRAVGERAAACRRRLPSARRGDSQSRGPRAPAWRPPLAPTPGPVTAAFTAAVRAPRRGAACRSERAGTHLRAWPGRRRRRRSSGLRSPGPWQKWRSKQRSRRWGSRCARAGQAGEWASSGRDAARRARAEPLQAAWKLHRRNPAQAGRTSGTGRTEWPARPVPHYTQAPAAGTSRAK